MPQTSGRKQNRDRILDGALGYWKSLRDLAIRVAAPVPAMSPCSDILLRLAKSVEITPEKQAIAEILATLIEAYEERYVIEASTY